MNETFTFSPRLKMISIVLMALGLLSLIGGFVVYGGTESHRVWANLLLNGVFFLSIGIGCAFFMAAHYLGWGGWQVVLKRISEATVGWLVVIVPVFTLILLAGHSSLYEWTHPEAQSDPIIAGKLGYLNLPFFFIRLIIFLGVLTVCAVLLRKASLKEDTLMAGDISMHKRSLVIASVFIPVFAVYILVSAWDWLMSLDVHWFSTMYGWYAFASFWVTSIAVITLIFIYLKNKGYLKEANENHLHTLGIMLFAFSIFWTYVTFGQFMLIWYANIPEETIYFQQRYGDYKPLFYALWIINFVLPFMLLMSRDAKRKTGRMAFVSVIIIVGHFLDYYLMIMPAVVGTKPVCGFLEFGLPLLFIGAFIFIVFTQLSKATLVPKNHPYLQESLNHSV